MLTVGSKFVAMFSTENPLVVFGDSSSSSTNPGAACHILPKDVWVLSSFHENVLSMIDRDSEERNVSFEQKVD